MKVAANSPSVEIEPVLLLRIDGDAEPPPAGGLRQLDQPRQQLARQTMLLARIEARVQGRELDRDARARQQLLGGRRAAHRRRGATDGLDRADIAVVVALRVLGRLGALAQHVVGEAVALGLQRCSARQRLLDGAPEHEVVAQDAHGVAQGLADEGFPRAGDQALEHRPWAGALGLAQLHHASREHQPEGGRIYEQAVGVAEMPLPAAAADLLGDQRVGGFSIGYAQQRLGQAHQDDALLRGEAVLVHEGIDAAVPVAVGTRGMHQARGLVGDAGALGRREDGALDQAADKPRLVHQVIGRNLVARRQLRGSGRSIVGRLGLPDRAHVEPPGRRGGRPESRAPF